MEMEGNTEESKMMIESSKIRGEYNRTIDIKGEGTGIVSAFEYLGRMVTED